MLETGKKNSRNPKGGLSWPCCHAHAEGRKYKTIICTIKPYIASDAEYAIKYSTGCRKDQFKIIQFSYITL